MLTLKIEIERIFLLDKIIGSAVSINDTKLCRTRQANESFYPSVVNESPKTADFLRTSHHLLMTNIKIGFSKIILNLIVIESNWHYSLINE